MPAHHLSSRVYKERQSHVDHHLPVWAVLQRSLFVVGGKAHGHAYYIRHDRPNDCEGLWTLGRRIVTLEHREEDLKACRKSLNLT